jgi:hypothetical protein
MKINNCLNPDTPDSRIYRIFCKYIRNLVHPLILTIGVQTKENLHINTVEMAHEPFLHNKQPTNHGGYMKRVKINSKMVMLLAMFAMIFTFNACDGSGGGDDDGNSSSSGGDSSSSGPNGTTQEQAILLTDGKWAEGKITATSREVWYKFDVVAGNYYYWWNDYSSGPKTYHLDVKVAAYYSSADNTLTNHQIFENEYIDDLYDYTQWITNYYDGTIYFKVVAYSEEHIGSFGIAFSTNSTMPSGHGTDLLGMCKADYECTEYISNVWNANTARQNCDGTWTARSTCPEGYDQNRNDIEEGKLYYFYPEPIEVPANTTSLTQGVFTNGSITSSAKEIWYSFDVTSGSTYWVYLEDYPESGYTLDTKIQAYYSDKTEVFVNYDYDLDFGRRSFTATSSGKVYLRASPYYRGQTGTFAVKYDKWTAPTSTTPLTFGVSRDDAISNTVREIWYSFDVIGGTGYSVYMNDAMSGEGKTLNATRYEACYSDGTEIFYTLWESAYLYAEKTDKVYLKVSSLNNVSTGTFSVLYNESEECYDCYGAPKAAPKANVLSKTSKISKKK